MKKIALMAGVAALSTSAMADIGLKVELGYESATVAPSYGDCWSECFGDGEPTGAALNIEWQVMGVPGMYIELDYADLKDKEDHYDDTPGTDEVTIEQKRTAFEIGYSHALNDKANVLVGLRQSDVEWSYEWDNGNPSSSDTEYLAEDKGTSLILGANTMATETVAIGTSFSAGFETGISAYVQFALTEQAAIKAEMSRSSYELGDFERRRNGDLSGGPVDTNDDGDYQFDNDTLRVSASYTF